MSHPHTPSEDVQLCTTPGRRMPTLPPVSDALRQMMDRMRGPTSLKERLLRDSYGGSYYNRLDSATEIKAEKSHADPSPCMCFRQEHLVKRGTVGRAMVDGQYFWLSPGYHDYATCCTALKFLSPSDVNSHNKAQINGPLGFVTITEGHIGILSVSGEYRLLPPGTYEWSSPAVLFEGVKDISHDGTSIESQCVIKLGPYSIINVPPGYVAITFDNGKLRVLGDWDSATHASVEQGAQTHPEVQSNYSTPQSSSSDKGHSYFLDDPCWTFSSFLCLRTRTDELEGNNLLSRDNVELAFRGMSHWRVVDPVLSITRCGKNIEAISQTVNSLVRATIARIVAGTNIGAGDVASGAVGAKPDREKQPDLADLMQSDQAQSHLDDLREAARYLGIEVSGVYVPDKRMKNDEVRREIASQALIEIEAQTARSSADARSYATIQAARAQGEATVTNARARAEAIKLVAKANSEAGARLGQSESTAARLALTAATAAALKNAKMTIMSGVGERMK